jgi:hypothetical protein
MKMNKLPWPVRALIATGLLLTTTPLLFKDYLDMPDFVRGALEGVGIGLEISGIILMRKMNKWNSGCNRPNVMNRDMHPNPPVGKKINVDDLFEHFGAAPDFPDSNEIRDKEWPSKW